MNEDVRVLETVTNKQVCVMSQQGDFVKVIGKGIKIIIIGVRIHRKGAQAAHTYVSCIRFQLCPISGFWTHVWLKRSKRVSHFIKFYLVAGKACQSRAEFW